MVHLPEHAAPQSDAPEGDNYQPTDEEKKTIKTVEKLLSHAKKSKSLFDEKWNDWFNMYRGRQWKEQRPSYRHSEVINLIFREIQSNVPIQMDARPKFEYLPMEPNDIELAEIVNQVCEADWVKYNWLEQLTEMVYDANIFGTGIGYMCFDPQAEQGLGAVDFKSKDPFYIFPDAMASDVNKGGKYFIEVEPMSLEQIKKTWPNGKYVKSDMLDIKKADIFDKDKVRIKSPIDSMYATEGAGSYTPDEQPQSLVITCYFASGFEIEESQEEKQMDDGSVDVRYVQKKKYPNGRKVVMASKVILQDAPNEYEDDKFPFARVQNYINQRQFWGISDVEQLESPQKVFNKLVCFSLDVLTLMGNPIWVVGTGSGVDTDNLINAPGLVIEPDDVSQVRREEGVQLQPFVLQLIDRLKSWFDDVSGSSDVSRGIKPEGVTAASAIEHLQEASQTRLRQKSRNLDVCLQSLGQLYLSRIFQYYTAPRIFRLTNKDGSMRFFKFHVEHQPQPDGSVNKVARFRSYSQAQDGRMVENPEKAQPINGMLDVKVSTGSSLPFMKAEKENKLLAYFDRGIIDEEEVLKGSDFPNWEAVNQRVMEKKAAMAQAEQQQAPPQ